LAISREKAAKRRCLAAFSMFQNVQKCLEMNIFSGAFMVQTRFVIRIMGILVRIWCKKIPAGSSRWGRMF
jgi:hypothetical protein